MFCILEIKARAVCGEVDVQFLCVTVHFIAEDFMTSELIGIRNTDKYVKIWSELVKKPLS